MHGASGIKTKTFKSEIQTVCCFLFVHQVALQLKLILCKDIHVCFVGQCVCVPERKRERNVGPTVKLRRGAPRQSLLMQEWLVVLLAQLSAVG